VSGVEVLPPHSALIIEAIIAKEVVDKLLHLCHVALQMDICVCTTTACVTFANTVF